MTAVNAVRPLDCPGLFCPVPVIETKRELGRMKPGETPEILADDPGFEKDLPARCAKAGERFLGITKEGAALKGYVQKK